MRAIILALVLCLGYFAAAKALDLPPYIHKCSKKDPNLNTCILRSAQNALPKIIKGDAEYGIPVLDPFFIEKIVVGDRPGFKLGLTFTCENCKVTGLAAAKITGIKVDFNRRKIQFEANAPVLTLTGQYKAKGKILALEIDGEGDINVQVDGGSIVFKNEYDIVRHNDNNEYVKFKNPTLEFKVDNIKFHLSNLAKNDKTLGEKMNIFLNKNWKQGVEILGPIISKIIAEEAVQILNGVLDKFPYDVIFNE